MQIKFSDFFCFRVSRYERQFLTYYPFIKLPHYQCQIFDFFLECTYGDINFQLPVHKI
jgi:hypothetical protein